MAIASMVPSRMPSIERITVGGGAQRRVHLVMGVEVADILVNQGEMVRRDLGADAQLVLLGRAHGLQRLGGREMGDVQTSAGLARQGDIALDDACFRRVRHSMYAQPKRGGAIIHRAAAGHSRVFGVLHHGHLEPRAPL